MTLLRRYASRLLFATVVAAGLLCSGTALAQKAPEDPGKPSADEAARVIDFFYHGQGKGVVLAKARVCSDVPTTGENRLECVGPVATDALVRGTTYNLHMMYLVPEGDRVDDIEVEYVFGGEAIKTDTVDVEGSLRYRTWTAFTPRESGNGTIRISQAGEVLNEISVTVQDG